MSTKDEAMGFMPLTTGDALLDGFLRDLNQSGRSDTETVLTLARAVLWTSMNDLEWENAEMTRAWSLMCNGAAVFGIATVDEVKGAGAK